jgi:hypothetical protein
MKRLLRVVVVLAALGGIAWALRDRLISIPAPREESPPAFRVKVPAGSPAGSNGASEA